jgi:hypothetical protein
MTYDALVVGAGHNGLVTACYRPNIPWSLTTGMGKSATSPQPLVARDQAQHRDRTPAPAQRTERPDKLMVEVYAQPELQYVKLMLKAMICERPFFPQAAGALRLRMRTKTMRS